MKISKKIRSLATVLFATVLLGLAACDSPEEKAQAYYQNALQLFEEENFEKADLEFRNALQLDPAIADAWYYLALLEEKNGKVRQYAGDLMKAVEIDPNHVAAQTRLGKIMLFSGRSEEAREKAELVLRLAPEDPDVWALKASVHLQAQESEEAVKAARKAIELEAGHVEGSLVVAVQQIGDKNFEDALKTIEISQQVHPESVPLLLTQMRVYQLQKNSEGIEKTFRELIKVDPDNRQFRTNLTRFYLSQGNKDKAEAEIRSIAEANPEDTNAKLDVVRYLQSVSGLEVAKAELQKIIKEEPQEYIYQLALSEMQVVERDLEGAKTTLQGVIDSAGVEEDGLTARMKLAELLLRDGNVDEVARLIDETLTADSLNLNALTMRAAMSLDQGKVEEAVTDLRSALKDQPEDARATLLLARAHEMNGAVELADDRFNAALKMARGGERATLQYAQFQVRRQDYDRAVDILQEGLKRSPKSRELLTTLAQVYLLEQNWEGAEKVAKQIEAIDKDSVVSSQILGRSYAGQNDLEKSLQAFQQAHTNVPQGVNTMVAMTRLYLAQGQPDEAINFLQGVVTGTPDNYPARLLLAQVYLTQDRDEDALKIYQNVIKEKPDYPSAYYTLFTYNMRKQNLDGAQSALDQGLEALPNSYMLQMAQAGLYEQQEKYPDAIKVYEKILERNPNVDLVANNLASLISTVYEDEENLRRAYTFAKRFRSSTVPHFQDTLGWIHYKLGEYEIAVDLLEKAVKKMPNFGTLRYHLGMAYLAQKNTVDAKSELQAAVDVGAKQPFPELQDAQKQLKDIKTP